MVVKKVEDKLKRLKLETEQDLLYYFPRSYVDTAEVSSIKDLVKGERAVIFGQISGLKMKKACFR